MIRKAKSEIRNKSEYRNSANPGTCKRVASVPLCSNLIHRVVMRTPFSSLLLRLSSFALLFLCSVLTPQSSVLSQTVTSPPPAEIVFVPHPDGSFLTKHPTLPVLYLGCYIAPDAKNLATFQLNTDGTLNTNSIRAFNYFSVNPTNVFYRYQVQRPIVLAEEK